MKNWGKKGLKPTFLPPKIKLLMPVFPEFILALFSGAEHKSGETEPEIGSMFERTAALFMIHNDILSPQFGYFLCV